MVGQNGPRDDASFPDPAAKMDRMYRWTRHVYDLTRRYYLLGRDEMLDRIVASEPRRVLEVGCGTGRNLRVLADMTSGAQLYGVDASLAMLATARDALDRADCTGRVTLAQGLAEQLDARVDLGVDGSFDVLFFSYALSMIPAWRAALARALAHLAPGGRLYVVDFWDQANLPPGIPTLLQGWLDLFDVRPRPELIQSLRTLGAAGYARCTVDSIAGRYAYLAAIEIRGDGADAAAHLRTVHTHSGTTNDSIEPTAPSPLR